MILTLLKIQGHSMEPTIKNGSFILVSSIPYLFSEPRIDDIVAFEKNGKIFIKRIKMIKNEHYFLKGDNPNDSLEVGWIHQKDTIGKVIKRIL